MPTAQGFAQATMRDGSIKPALEHRE